MTLYQFLVNELRNYQAQRSRFAKVSGDYHVVKQIKALLKNHNENATLDIQPISFAQLVFTDEIINEERIRTRLDSSPTVKLIYRIQLYLLLEDAELQLQSYEQDAFQLAQKMLRSLFLQPHNERSMNITKNKDYADCLWLALSGKIRMIIKSINCGKFFSFYDVTIKLQQLGYLSNPMNYFSLLMGQHLDFSKIQKNLDNLINNAIFTQISYIHQLIHLCLEDIPKSKLLINILNTQWLAQNVDQFGNSVSYVCYLAEKIDHNAYNYIISFSVDVLTVICEKILPLLEQHRIDLYLTINLLLKASTIPATKDLIKLLEYYIAFESSGIHQHVRDLADRSIEDWTIIANQYADKIPESNNQITQQNNNYSELPSLKKTISCPISFEIFRHPVTLIPSNEVFELRTILNYFRTKREYECPITRKTITDVLLFHSFKSLIDDFIKRYPEETQYENYDAQKALTEIKHILNPQPLATNSNNTLATRFAAHELSANHWSSSIRSTPFNSITQSSANFFDSDNIARMSLFDNYEGSVEAHTSLALYRTNIH